MGPMMRSCLMVLLCAFCIHADVDVQPDFDLAKFSGKWHVMAAVSDCDLFQKMKPIMTTSATIVKPLPNGDTELVTGFPLPKECKKMKMLLKKTDQPGHFTSDDETGKKDVRVMATDYDNFAFLYIFKEAEGEPSSTSVQLYTRLPKITKEVMEIFKQLYHKVGLTDDLMVEFPWSDLCSNLLRD
ncbi:lipocalin-15-like [Rhineura floridana]|uniref:lipocalin-15-like n=1 Tax=Rhineura floridana TaxID=261503 RepID=UPI002AC8404E|nr:lipocalin-15-like [Rhineura floridana]